MFKNKKHLPEVKGASANYDLFNMFQNSMRCDIKKDCHFRAAFYLFSGY